MSPLRKALCCIVVWWAVCELLDAFVPIAWAEAAGASLRHLLCY